MVDVVRIPSEVAPPFPVLSTKTDFSADGSDRHTSGDAVNP